MKHHNAHYHHRPRPVMPVFHDTFALGIDQWDVETGEMSPGQQTYTNDNWTSGIEGLRITARPDRTSARVVTRMAPFTPGTRLSFVVAMADAAAAVWPACWAIGESLVWPDCGEIDVMECGLGGKWSLKQTVHDREINDACGDAGLGPFPASVPSGLSLYVAEWYEDGMVRFAANGRWTGQVHLTTWESMKIVINVALREAVDLQQDWAMIVKEVSVDPLSMSA